MTESEANSSYSFVPDEFAELIQAARSGSTVALNTISEGCRNYLLLIANQELDLDLRNKLGPSDIVQTSLMAVHENIGAFAGDNLAQFLAWARTILLNDLRRARRDLTQVGKRDVRREIPMTGASNSALDFNAGDATPGTRAVANEEARQVAVAIGRLPPEHQQVIRLRNWEQQSFEQIGISMNRSADAAQKLWKRAIVRLKSELKSLDII